MKGSTMDEDMYGSFYDGHWNDMTAREAAGQMATQSTHLWVITPNPSVRRHAFAQMVAEIELLPEEFSIRRLRETEIHLKSTHGIDSRATFPISLSSAAQLMRGTGTEPRYPRLWVSEELQSDTVDASTIRSWISWILPVFDPVLAGGRHRPSRS